MWGYITCAKSKRIFKHWPKIQVQTSDTNKKSNLKQSFKQRPQCQTYKYTT